MSSRFLKPSDPRLRRISEPVDLGSLKSTATRRDLETLYDIAYGEQSDRAKPVLVGVAAPQIGILRRIILVDVAADGRGHTGDLRAFINPVITHRSADTAEWYEGCYSTGAICGIVSRPTSVTMSAYTPKGEHVTQQFTGYAARIILHETEHLDGKFFVDRITEPSKLHWVNPDEYPLYRDNGGWRHWKALAPRGIWDDMVRGVAS